MAGDHTQPPIRVLIADDDSRVRAALRTFLCANPGFTVIGEAGCAATALELAREHLPTVALVDVFLPEQRDGLGLLRALTGELGIPVVVISIHNDACSAALAAGAHRFVDKVAAPEALLTALRTAVPGHVS
jgi:DNA-binding NarL/FixJ family response regulator